MKRRALLALLLASGAAPAWAQGLTGAIRPRARPVQADPASVAPRQDMRPRARPSVQDLIREADLGGVVGFVALDLATGQEIEAGDAPLALPPASVTKVFTSLYALETLGAGYRFQTRFIATGPVAEGIVQGDLVLSGGGDPALVTEHLVELVARLAASGVKGITGRFLCWGGALPGSREIDPGQAPHLGYNPGVGGLNLNFNRVNFEWTRAGGNYATRMTAFSDSAAPEVQLARIEVQDREGDLFNYRDGGDGRDLWTVRRNALNERGSRWLPVRDPTLYAGEAARALAAAQGITLPAPEVTPARVTGTELARWDSAPLSEICRDLLHYSTNLTAEVIGLAATARRTGRLVPQRASAREMALWVLQRTGVAARFVDHSGLQDATRVSARAMVRLLTARGAQGLLAPILKQIAMTEAQGEVMRDFPVHVVAKTGTLNFVTTLAGYVTGPGGGSAAFAIFAANEERRAATLGSTEDWPPGAEAWNLRARRLQQQLLQRWGKRL